MNRAERKRVPGPIAEKIGMMRRAVIRFFVVGGLNKLLLAVFAFVAVDFVIDRSFRMDKSQRIIMLLLGIALLLWVAWKYLVRPLFSRLTDDALLLQVEERDKEMGERLISALELSRMEIGENDNISRGMVEHTIEEGARAGDEIDMNRVFRRGKMRFNSVLCVCLACVFGSMIAAVALSKPAQTWFNRNILLGDAQWPQDYFLEVAGIEDGKLRVPRGDDWTISARVADGHRSLPEEVFLEMKTGGGRRSESMVAVEGRAEFRGEFRNVLDEFEFRLTSKEAETGWYRVELVDRPQLESFSLSASEPEYTGVGTRELPAGAGPYYLLDGTSLAVAGTSDKPLSSAALVLGEKRFDLQVKASGFSGRIDSKVLEAGTFELEIEDEERMAIPGREGLVGLGPREPTRFKVRMKNDRKPRVVATLQGVSGMVVPDARLPFIGSVADDFSVDSIDLHFEWKQDNSEGEPKTGTASPGDLKGALGKPEVALDGTIEIGPWEVPVNSRLSLKFAARDNDTVNGPKIGESTTMLLRVVGEAELRTDLLRREKEQRQILEEMVRKQDLLLTDSGALAAESRDLDKLDPSQLERVVALQKRQKLAGSNLKPIIARLEGMVQEILNNRLEAEDGVLKARLNEKVIVPLRMVQESIIPNAAMELDAARRSADSGTRQEAFARAADSQRKAIAALREILKNMVRNEGYQMAVNLLYEIQRAQERMLKMTEKTKEEALGEVLQDGKENGDENKDHDNPPTNDGANSPKDGPPPSVENTASPKPGE